MQRFSLCPLCFLPLFAFPFAPISGFFLYIAAGLFHSHYLTIDMRWMKWTGIAAAAALIASCFMVWVYIVSKKIVVTGVESTGTSFGKPGYMHFILSFFFIVFSLVPRLGAKRVNVVVAALNLAWALRNYFFIATCSGGECPEKHTGLYLALLSSVLMLVASMFPDIKINTDSKN